MDLVQHFSLHLVPGFFWILASDSWILVFKSAIRNPQFPSMPYAPCSLRYCLNWKSFS